MFTVVWSQQARRATSAQDVDRLLDGVHAELADKDPELVTVELSETGDSLAIGLGRDRSVLNYVDGSKDPPYYTSIGELEADDMVAFRFGGQWSEFPIRNSIPTPIARQAMQYFCTTGRLSPVVRWEED